MDFIICVIAIVVIAFIVTKEKITVAADSQHFEQIREYKASLEDKMSLDEKSSFSFVYKYRHNNGFREAVIGLVKPVLNDILKTVKDKYGVVYTFDEVTEYGFFIINLLLSYYGKCLNDDFKNGYFIILSNKYLYFYVELYKVIEKNMMDHGYGRLIWDGDMRLVFERFNIAYYCVPISHRMYLENIIGRDGKPIDINKNKYYRSGR